MQEHISYVDGRRIHYREGGEGSPVLLIHGLSGSGRWWLQNIDYLARSHHVYVIDLVGFGRSRRQHFYLTQAAPLIAKWMEQIGIDAATLIGHSMGGFISIDLAACFPAKVERLVVVDAPALPLERSRAKTAVRLARALMEMPRPFLPILFGDGLQAGPRTVYSAAHELMHSDISYKIGLVRAPTLVVWGDHDWLVPLSMGVRIYDRLPNAEFVVIDHAGHNPMWDRADRFNEIVEHFIQHGSLPPCAQ
ncbi:MAG: alpha/beta hydrolase, partial [Caldilineaceae bacterium]|nr:alpha/beta hydrolase [Caldilineaceae bacterium]